MSRLRHIALSVPDPWKAAEFYMKAFGMKKVGETDSSLARGVYLTDGFINMALLNYKSDEAAGEERGKERAVEEEESAAQGVGEERHQDSME